MKISESEEFYKKDVMNGEDICSTCEACGDCGGPADMCGSACDCNCINSGPIIKTKITEML